MPDTRNADTKAAHDLESEMEQLILPLGIAVEAAGELLRRYAYDTEKYLSQDVAEIVGCALSESFEGASNRLIEFARRAEGNDAPVRPTAACPAVTRINREG